MGFYNPRPEKNLVVDRILKWIVDIITVASIAVFALTYFSDETEVIGSSMSEVLEDGQTGLIDKLSYKLSKPERFDIIVYKSKVDDGQYVIKRIIGLPGEKIRISDSKIYVDGVELEDKYFKGSYESGSVSEEITVGGHEYFVLGDNRNLSEDSRFEYIGNIEEDEIVGKVWFIISPIKQIGIVKN